MSKIRKNKKKSRGKGMHIPERALERYNLDLTRVDEDLIVSKIFQGDSLYLRNDGINEFHYVTHKKIPVKILYNPEFRMIITPYPFQTEEYEKLAELKKEETERENNMNFEEIGSGISSETIVIPEDDYNIEPWCDIAGYKSFNINDEIYLKRSDIFLNNNKVVVNFITKKTIKKHTDFITLRRDGFSEEMKELTNSKVLSFMKVTTLPRLLEETYLNNHPDIVANIQKIIEAGSSPMSAEDTSKYIGREQKNLSKETIGFNYEPLIRRIDKVVPGKSIEELFPEDMTIKKDAMDINFKALYDGNETTMSRLLNRLAIEPDKVKLIPYLKEASIIDLLKQSQDTLTYAIKELEEKEDIKNQLEIVTKKFNTLQADQYKSYENLTKINEELQEIKEDREYLREELAKGHEGITNLIDDYENKLESLEIESAHKTILVDELIADKEESKKLLNKVKSLFING